MGFTGLKTGFLQRVLERPSYGFERDGKLYVPTHKEIFREFFTKINVFKDKRNWVPFFSWAATLSLSIPLVVFFANYFTWPLFFLGFVYSMVALGTHGTIYLHRYSTHRAFKFRNPVWRFICRNLVVKLVLEELYVVSHHVHHQLSEKPGDPYNVKGGWLYCFLADVTHQPIAKNLNEADYEQLTKMLNHTGVHINTYKQYKKWGSLCHPSYAFLHYALNWSFWYLVFFLIGGQALASCLLGWSAVWGIGVRTFNFDGHGSGKDKRREGIDFYNEDHSINQVWPGCVAGEWHNNHHLYPNGARAGFLPYQLDLAWLFIKSWHLIGGVSSYRDYKNDFMRDYYLPYLKNVSVKEEASCANVVSPKNASL